MEYSITNNSSILGNLLVEPTISKIELERTPDGVRWLFPAEIQLHGFEGEFSKSERDPYLRADGGNQPIQLSWGLRGMAVDLCMRQNNENVHIARAVLPDALHAGRQSHKCTLGFPFYISAQAVAFIERIRQDKDLEVSWFFSAETFWLALDVYSWRSPVCQPFQNKTGPILQRVPREPWIGALRNLGLSENILVEVPLMRNPGVEWHGVWDNLVAARSNFDKGMWNETVRRVRTAFEAWQVRWKEKGKPWKLCAASGQSAAELDKISKEDRLADILFVAKRFADKASHSTDDTWTRDDALLAVGICAALWNTIRPHD